MQVQNTNMAKVVGCAHFNNIRVSYYYLFGFEEQNCGQNLCYTYKKVLAIVRSLSDSANQRLTPLFFIFSSKVLNFVEENGT